LPASNQSPKASGSMNFSLRRRPACAALLRLGMATISIGTAASAIQARSMRARSGLAGQVQNEYASGNNRSAQSRISPIARRGRRLYAAWHQGCEREGRPFAAWEGSQLRIDLICTPLRLCDIERHDLDERWRQAICREPEHRYRRVHAASGPVGGR
jgi:hypothetical protein